MNIVKGIYRAAQAYIQKASVASTIRQYDEIVPRQSWNGVEFYSAMIEPIEIPPPNLFSVHGTQISHDIGREAAQLAASVIEKLKPRIVGYLGPNVRLDEFLIHWFDPAKSTSNDMSGSWHNDNVGHRLKLYICLEGEGSTPTVVLPGSQMRTYRFHYSEFRRFFGFMNTKHKQGEIQLRYCTGDVAIFDTHCFHRGLYEESANKRVVIIVEFINRHKANKISGKTPCGPTSTPTGKVIFTREGFDALNSTGLIDHELVRLEGERVTYSLANRR